MILASQERQQVTNVKVLYLRKERNYGPIAAKIVTTGSISPRLHRTTSDDQFLQAMRRFGGHCLVEGLENDLGKAESLQTR